MTGAPPVPAAAGTCGSAGAPGGIHGSVCVRVHLVEGLSGTFRGFQIWNLFKSSKYFARVTTFGMFFCISVHIFLSVKRVENKSIFSLVRYFFLQSSEVNKKENMKTVSQSKERFSKKIEVHGFRVPFFGPPSSKMDSWCLHVLGEISRDFVSSRIERMELKKLENQVWSTSRDIFWRSTGGNTLEDRDMNS